MGGFVAAPITIRETAAARLRRIWRQSTKYGNVRTSGLLATAPTFTWSAANTAPTTPGLQFFNMADATGTKVFRVSGGAIANSPASANYKTVAAATFVSGGNLGATKVAGVFRFEVMVDSVSPIFKLYGSTVGYRVIVDGQYVDMTGVVPPGTFAGYYLTMDFTNAGGRKRRVIAIEGSDQYHACGGVYVAATEGAYQTDGDDLLTGVFLGDSFFSATAATNKGDGFARIVGDKLGVRNTVQSGIGGTGYVVDGGQYNFGGRVQPDLVALNPDFAVIGSGLNDATFPKTTTEVCAAFVQLVRTIRSAPGLSKMPLFILGPWNGRTGPSAGVIAMDTALSAQAAAMNDPYLFYIQTLGWITGTGAVGATTGTGNSDLYSAGSGDPTHPNSAGYAHLADLTVNAMLSAIANAV